MPQLLKSTLLFSPRCFRSSTARKRALFLSLTRYYTGDQRMILSRRIALNSIALIVASYFVGSHILDFFGISIPVVQVAADWCWPQRAGRC